MEDRRWRMEDGELWIHLLSSILYPRFLIPQSSILNPLSSTLHPLSSQAPRSLLNVIDSGFHSYVRLSK